jgi:predicted dehydrogenase
MARKLELAFVGCGAVADLHWAGIQGGARDLIEVAAAVDPDRRAAERIASRAGARVFGSLEDALEGGGFEAVDLMLPHRLHESAAIAALEAGKHVLLEKPIALSVESAERILEAARRSRRVFMVAENSQYWPEVTRARELIERGAIGEVVTARACANSRLDRSSPFYAGERPWRFDRRETGGGIGIDLGSHWIRPLRIWMGEIAEVAAALDHPAAEMEGESLVRALLRFASGRCASFEAAALPGATLGPDALFRITGSRGEIAIESRAGGQLVLYDAEHPGGQREEPGGYLAAFALELADFARAVLEGVPPAAGAEMALGDLRAVQAMYRSAATGRWERVWD